VNNPILLVFWSAFSYALGCLNGAYYLHRVLRGSDIRSQGTGNPGARNAGRVIGKGAFLLVFLVDAGKGALAVAGALAIGLGVTGAAISAVAVVLGHILPVQLGFRGGKGIATAFGVTIVLDPPLALLGLALAGLTLVVLHRPALAGTLAVLLAPIIALFMGREAALIWGLSGIAALALIAHRADIMGVWTDRIQMRFRSDK
jgi:glycerol-3-phosphate acyltransferase PlsY